MNKWNKFLCHSATDCPGLVEILQERYIKSANCNLVICTEKNMNVEFNLNWVGLSTEYIW
jgi:hypothetical protein